METIKKIIKNILPYGVIKFLCKNHEYFDNTEHISYNRFQDMSLNIRNSIKDIPYDIDLIVGVPRSGMIPAYMISLFLNKPCCSLTEFKKGISPENGERKLRIQCAEYKKILIVDDSVGSGRANSRVRFELNNMISRYEFLYYAVFVTDDSKKYVDFYAKIVPFPRIFQWNYMNHSILERSCMDIDGVLCVDPTDIENDDGESYKYFLLNAKPLYIPTVKIHALVTARLEKYRNETEIWLNKNDVRYDKLIMLDLTSGKDRLEKNIHAVFKADVFKKDRYACLFIESNDKQAREIAKLSNKPCICVETDSLYE